MTETTVKVPFKDKANAKRLFLVAYNDYTVKSKDLPAHLNTLLQEAGELEPNFELSPELIKDTYNNKLGLDYRNRPRKAPKQILAKVVYEVEFDEEDPTFQGNLGVSEALSSGSTSVEGNLVATLDNGIHADVSATFDLQTNGNSSLTELVGEDGMVDVTSQVQSRLEPTKDEW